MFFQPPFPEPTEIESVAVFVHIGIIFFLIILMIYCYQNLNDYLPIIVIYGFSLIIGFESLAHPHVPFSPMIEIFFVLFQTTIFIMASLDSYKINKKRKITN